MDRQHRHDLKHDKFVDEIGALSSRAQENQRFLLLIAGGLIAVAVITYGIFFYRGQREEKAQLLLATAIETFDSAVGDPAQAQPGAPAPKFKTEADRNVAAEKQFKDVQAQYSGTDASDVAGLYLARLSVNKGDIASARKQFQQFIGSHKNNILVDGAKFSLYQLRIDNGEAAQVATELEAELAKADPVLPGDALLVLQAQAFEVQGNQEKSRASYRRITTEFPDSQYVVEAQRRIGTGA